ncbi:MAG TPA: hypothetical protein VMX75_04205 [Spirochaetia bacterium]|nr:hypothetical protein [Spirochaetia bacterium]
MSRPSTQPSIGLLPLYLKLYDDAQGDRRRRIEEFYGIIAREFEKRNLNVVTSPICRLEKEFASAVKNFEESGVDAIVTLHMAYSPSLESAGVLAKTPLPVVVCDTTPTYSFGPGQEPEELMYNHGIHGVQDMCNLLIRNGKPFEIAAGHWERSDVLDRTVSLVRSARMASHMRRIRAGLIGRPFTGMGDFYVPADRLRETIGVETVTLSSEGYRRLVSEVKEDEIAREMEEDRKRFDTEGLNQEAWLRTVRTGLAVSRWIEKERLSAFSYNFLDIRRDEGFETVPFLAASKMMARGIGFAGEGDLLTASLVSTLALNNPDTSFTEMFCPDWEGNTVFLSHMGEMNCNLVEGKARLVEMNYSYSDADNPVFAAGRFRSGDILLVNLAPIGGAGYRLILAPVKIIDAPEDDRWKTKIRAWFEPPMAVAEFLTRYSRVGGTHHLALTYKGASGEGTTETIGTFGRMMGWETVTIE